MEMIMISISLGTLHEQKHYSGLNEKCLVVLLNTQITIFKPGFIL